MSWGRMDDGFDSHPKVEHLSIEAVGVWTLCWSRVLRHRKTAPIPGFVSEAAVRKVAGRRFNAITRELTTPIPGKKFGLWEKVDGGFLFHNFARYLPRQRDPEELREAGKRGMASRYGHSKQLADSYDPASEEASNPVADGIATDNSRVDARAFPSRPVPYEETKEGGERHQTLPASGDTATPPPNTTPRCAAHKHLPDHTDPGPCAGCKRARLAHEKHEATQAETARLARDNCTHCHGTGWIEDHDGRPRDKCTHPPPW